jgi:ATP-dependent RNA helicase DDX19/DBP5
MTSRSNWQTCRQTPTTLSSQSRPSRNSDCKFNLLICRRVIDSISNDNILKGVFAMNFRKPSKVQEKTLPLLLMNPPQNLIGQSQSGTGKTAAFVLNILARLDLSSPQARKTPQALILAPTRELARQIQQVITLMGSFIDGLIVEAAVPTDVASRTRQYEAAVVVGTAGTVIDALRKKNMNPSAVKILVLDEADNMLEQQGMGDQCLRVKR